jgi:hypothetical protein
MNVKNIRDWFEVLQTTKRTQTAMMTLKPGKSSGSEPEGQEERSGFTSLEGGSGW